MRHATSVGDGAVDHSGTAFEELAGAGADAFRAALQVDHAALDPAAGPVLAIAFLPASDATASRVVPFFFAMLA